MVDLSAHVELDCHPKELGVTELVYYPVLEKILEENDSLEDIKDAIPRDIHDLIPKHITKEIFLLLLTITCIWNTALETMTISTIWATVVSVL